MVVQPNVLPQSPCTIEFLDNSHISEPARELHSKSAPSVGGITAQSVQQQGEIPEEGRTEKNVVHVVAVIHGKCYCVSDLLCVKSYTRVVHVEAFWTSLK